MDKNKKIIITLSVLTVIFTIIGGTLAYWRWQTTEAQKTNVVFTVSKDFSCAADGGGNIEPGDVLIVPTEVAEENSAYYIKRTVTVTPTINVADKTIYMDLWLDINSIGTGLSNSDNFMYSFTTSDTSPYTDVVSSGNFKGKQAGNKVKLFTDNEYSLSSPVTFYLWIWLDAKETSSSTMNQSFSLSLNGSCTDVKVEPSSPVLDDGMIPITFDVSGDNTIIKTISEDDSSWYDYSNQEWANAILVTESSRNKYLDTTDVEVNQSDVLAYFVWIPRYKYRFLGLMCSTLENPTMEENPECYLVKLSEQDKTKLIDFWYQYIQDAITAGYLQITYTYEDATNDINDAINNGYFSDAQLGTTSIYSCIYIYNEQNSTDKIEYTSEFMPNSPLLFSTHPTEIEIVFESKEEISTGSKVGEYITHPAFWWDYDSDGVREAGEELSGIWVGKFETTGDATTPTILPDVTSLVSQDISTQFQTALKFAGGTLSGSNVTFAGSSTYGLTTNTDSHMMKNSEWGAVAYLSHSKYGVNREVYINNSQGYYTGRSGGNVGGSTPINGTYQDQSSTTQYNTYGFYTWDGYLLNYDTNTKSTTRDLTKVASTTGNITGVYDMSGGVDEYVMGNYNNIVASSGFSTFPSQKYYDLYTSMFSFTACNGGVCFGHALSETVGWYNDSDLFVSSSSFPWFVRGDNYRSGVNAGVFFFNVNSGTAISAARLVLGIGV